MPKQHQDDGRGAMKKQKPVINVAPSDIVQH